jgi:hypothetical protein
MPVATARRCAVAAGIGRETTKARLPQVTVNTLPRTLDGALYRARLVLVVLLTACLPIALFSPGGVHASTPVCRATDLTLFGGWQGCTMNVCGQFVLRNSGAQPCLLPPLTRIQTLDSSGAVVDMPIESRFDSAKSVLLLPGQEVRIPFIWFMLKAFCPAVTASPPIALRVSSDDADGTYDFHFGGTILQPQCGVPELPFGRLVIGPYGEPGPPQPVGDQLALPLTGTGGSAERSALPAGVLFALSGLLAAGGFVLALHGRELDAVSR